MKLNFRSIWVVGLSAFCFTGVAVSAETQIASELHEQALLLKSLSKEQRTKLFSNRDAKGNIRRNSKPQAGTPDLWSMKDPDQDKVAGTSTYRAYSELGLKPPSKPIVVAVIDSGVDDTHQDLQGQIDSAHGWNFIGNKNGKNLIYGTLEVTRELARLQRKQNSGAKLSAQESAYLDKLEADYGKQLSDAVSKVAALKAGQSAFAYLHEYGLTQETPAAVKALPEPAIPADATNMDDAKQLAMMMFEIGVDSAAIAETLPKQTAELAANFDLSLNESDTIGDNPDQLDQADYGNSETHVEGDDHGTHVSGIIGSTHQNKKDGMDGQMKPGWVQILPVRAIPDGDERDKDVANAVRYAVDQGAQIINMSFGKSYSPQKDYVDAAFKYAASKNVLVVHAAGNDSEDKDETANYPSRVMNDGTVLDNFMEIGASSKSMDKNLPATFSDYGPTTVDLFSPGVKIYSTIPGNQYAYYDGTSMATPEVVGIAALVLSQNSNLTAPQIRKLLMDSVKPYRGLQVEIPIPDDGQQATGMTDFANFSITGGIVNAYNALKMAQSMGASSDF